MAQAERLHSIAIQSVRWPRAALAFVAMVFALSAGLLVGGEPARFASMGIVYAPVIVLAGLVQLRRYALARIASWLWFWLTVAPARRTTCP
jgi:TRAP-type C4-dicarboxylate transport system permease large subunit